MRQSGDRSRDAPGFAYLAAPPGGPQWDGRRPGTGRAPGRADENLPPRDNRRARDGRVSCGMSRWRAPHRNPQRGTQKSGNRPDCSSAPEFPPETRSSAHETRRTRHAVRRHVRYRAGFRIRYRARRCANVGHRGRGGLGCGNGADPRSPLSDGRRDGRAGRGAALGAGRALPDHAPGSQQPSVRGLCPGGGATDRPGAKRRRLRLGAPLGPGQGGRLAPSVRARPPRRGALAPGGAGFPTGRGALLRVPWPAPSHG